MLAKNSSKRSPLTVAAGPARARAVRLCILALSPVLLTAQMAKADLSVNGTPGGTFTTNATNVYTSANSDPTTQTVAGLVVADGSGSGTGNGVASGSLSVLSGTYNLTSNSTAFVGQVNTNGTATISVSGGTLNLTAGGVMALANHTGNGTFSVSGGTFNLTIGANTFWLSRETSAGQINLTGGLFSTNSTDFEFTDGQGGSGVISFGAGSGQFLFTSTPTFANPNANSYFEFNSGSGGKLEITGYSQSQFATLVTAGEIKIDNATATTSSFAYSNVGGVGIYQLATSVVPEPTTWAAMLCGLGILTVFRSRRRLN